MVAKFEALIDSVADGERVPRHIAQALVDTENVQRDPSIVIKENWGGGSHGLTMITLRTAQSLGFSGTSGQLVDPTTNLHYGLRYLRQMFDHVGQGDWGRARWAYNVGPDLVPDWPASDKSRFLRNVAKWGPLKSTAAAAAPGAAPPAFPKPPTPIKAGVGGAGSLSLFVMMGLLIPVLWRYLFPRRRRT